MAISAFWRRKVDLPAMFGPVTSQMRPASRRPPAPSVAVVGDEGLALGAERLLDHRMAPALDREGERVLDHRPDIALGLGEHGEAGRDVEHGERLGDGA